MMRRWLTWIVICGVAVPVLILGLLHTPPVRRAAQARLSAYLMRSQGILLQAQGLDYNLLSPWVGFERIALQSAAAEGVRPFLTAERGRLQFRFRDLMRGDLRAETLEVERLSLDAVIQSNGSSNVRIARGETATQHQVRLPIGELKVSNLSLSFQDERTGFSASLPSGALKGSTMPPAGDQEFHYATKDRGSMRWSGGRALIDNLAFDFLLNREGVNLRSLHLTAEGNEISASGTLKDLNAPSLNVRAHAGLRASSVSTWLGLKQPLAGNIQADVDFSGRPESLAAEGVLASDELSLGGFHWAALTAKGRFEPAAGTLDLRELAAKVYGGQVQARGQIFLNEPRQSHIEGEARAVDLRRIGPAVGWPDPPAGTATVQFSASCPGNRWTNAAVKADAAVSFDVSRRLRPMPGITAALKAQLSERQIHVGVDSIAGFGASLRGGMDYETGTQSLSGDLEGNVQSLAQLIRQLEDQLGKPRGSSLPFTLDGRAGFHAILSGSLQDPQADLDIEGAGLVAGRVAGSSLRAQGEYGSGRFLVRDARLEWQRHRATASGEIGLATIAAPLRIEAVVEPASIAEILAGLGLNADVGGTASARIVGSGPRSDPHFSVQIETRDLQAYGVLLGDLSGEVELNPRDLLVKSLQIDKPPPGSKGTLQGRGTMTFDSRAYDFSLGAENLQVANPHLPWNLPVSGTLRLDAKGRGSLDNPAFQIETEWSEVKTSGASLGTLRASARFSDHRARLTVGDDAIGLAASADVEASGVYPVRFEINKDPKPYEIMAGGKQVGAVSATAIVRGSGTLFPPELQDASASLRDIKLDLGGGAIRAEGPLEASYAGRRLQLQPVTILSGGSRLRAAGDLPLDSAAQPGKIALQGDIDLDSIARLLSIEESAHMRGKAGLDAEIRGTWPGLEASANLTLQGGYLESAALPRALEDINATLRWIDRKLAVETFNAKIGEGAIRASAVIPLEFLNQAYQSRETSPAAPARFNLEADRVPVFPKEQAGERTGLFSAKVSGEASQPLITAIAARLEMTDASLGYGSISMRQAEPVTLQVGDGRVQIDQWRWLVPQGEMQLSGSVGLSGDYPLDLRMSGSADAAMISLLSPSASGKGAVRMDLRTLGSLRNPQLSGLLEMAKVNFGIRQPRLLVEDLDVRIGLENNRLEIQRLNGLLNGGRLQGSGYASLRESKLETVAIDLSAQDVFLEYPKGLRSSSNLRFQIRTRDSGVVIGGDVEIRDGSYLEPFDLTSLGGVELTSTGGPRGKTRIFGSEVRYDLGIKTAQPIAIDNNLARISVKADLRLAGGLENPGMLGRITVDRAGKIYFGGRVYYTERGVVTFANESRIDPVYDLLATTQVNEYQVALRLSGTGSEIAATFTSDPPLSQNDIVALLLTGKPQSESSGGTRVDPAQAEKMSMLSSVLNADLSARMRRRFGISQVMIQPSAISGESDPGARLTVGQDLSQSLRFVYSMNLVNSADQVWYAEYDFQRRLTARATMQNDNTYRTDIQQDLRFGGKEAASRQSLFTSGNKLKVGTVAFTGNPILSTSQLAREFKIAPGSKFDFAKSRKGIARLQKLYAKQDYLGARIYLDREEQAPVVNLTVQIEAGKKVMMQYTGSTAAASVDKEVRRIWQEGISDRQRTEDVDRQLRAYFAKRGYPQADIAVKTEDVSPDVMRVSCDVRPGARYKQVQTVFEGADPENAAALAVRLKLRKLEADVVTRPAIVVDSVTAYYRQKGYYLAKIGTPRFMPDEMGKIATFIFPVDEGPQISIRTLTFEGNQILASADLMKNLPLKEGSVLDLGQLRASVTAINEKYGRSGFRNSEIVPSIALDEKDAKADLAFAIHEGTRSIVQSVKVAGQERIQEGYIRRQLQIVAGEPENVPEINKSIRSLYNTGAFSQVDIESVPDKGAPAGGQGTEKVDVTVKVQEVAPFKFLYGGYYDSGRGPGIIANIENRNSLGNARVLGLRTRYDSELQENRLYFSQPLWGRQPRPTTATVYYTREKDYYQGLSARRIGFTLQQEVAIKKKFVVSYGYRFEDVHSRYVDQHAPDPPPAIVAPITLSLTRNTRDDFLDPTRGSFTSVALEYAPQTLGTTYGYTRIFSQYFKYFPLLKPGYVPFQEEVKKPRFIFATGVRAGLIKGLTSDQVIPTERFYAGGGTTVRGFKQDGLGPLDAYGNPLGGNAMLVLNNELRFPMASIFDAVGFVDIGNVFPLVTDFRFSELRKTAGFGLRLRTPVLMLRFDYGFKLDRKPGESRGAFFFSIGQAF